jgi:hypothetical protein
MKKRININHLREIKKFGANNKNIKFLIMKNILQITFLFQQQEK